MLNPYSDKKIIAAYSAPNNAPPKTKTTSFDFDMIKPLQV